MEIRHLRSFIAVARHLNFGRAARELHLSQPALSAQIKALEEDIGVQLLSRNRRSVSLTQAGASLLHDAQHLLEQLNESRERARAISSGEIGHLRIAFVASATVQIVPAIALAFRKRYPRVTLDLKNLPTVAQVEALRLRTLEAGFVRLPLHVPKLTVTPLHSEPFAMVLSKTHRLARKRALSVADLANEPFIAYAERLAPGFYQEWTGICRRAKFTPVVIQETSEMDTALALVAAGMGVAILPLGIASRYRDSLLVKPLTSEKIQSQIGIAVAEEARDPLVLNFVAFAKQVMKQSNP
ncbi:LysR family transcriptional regulator [Silvibacterium acidisoli]|uniref:LysR family transcriptional regulator n=1 Tax=Acidobacteriaceae bacterium ZG23-2 TaxID=2883246 RepID=UPI00406D0F90